MINQTQDYFFIGIAGTGMSALAQYLKGIGKKVSGSDRFFKAGEYNETRDKLEAAGIQCFEQNGTGITQETQCVIISSAIEETVPEMQKARQHQIPVLKRSELLAEIVLSKKTIAIGGTSGKSTTSAMIFDILKYAGLKPSIISGAGLVSIIKEGKIGNADVGNGDWLVIEADESDGSIIQYHAAIGLLLNVDKDHKELDVLMDVFAQFRNNSEHFIVNRSHPLAATLSTDIKNDFSAESIQDIGFLATDFTQDGLHINFRINNVPFTLQTVGRHNMENALAAAATVFQIGIPLEVSAAALGKYEGIYRRHQVLGQKNGIWLIDDYAHNPVKCARSIEACQPLAEKVIAWLQPHGYAPTKFLRKDFVMELSAALRPQDEIWMSEIFYAGGTTVKDISAADLVDDLRTLGKNAFFVEDRNNLVKSMRSHFSHDCVLLLMGARDPSLEDFASQIWIEL
jgi:UDP-N-acetylmuramate--alanine ligase